MLKNRSNENRIRRGSPVWVFFKILSVLSSSQEDGHFGGIFGGFLPFRLIFGTFREFLTIINAFFFHCRFMGTTPSVLSSPQQEKKTSLWSEGEETSADSTGTLPKNLKNMDTMGWYNFWRSHCTVGKSDLV